MSRVVNCVKLNREGEGLDRQPYPGALGQRIFDNVSKQAWQDWLRQQTMLINEYRLSPIEPEHRKFLEGEMEKYFFGEGSEVPEGYVPEDRLSPMDPKARKFLEEQMEKYFFGEGAETPPDFMPQK